MVLRRVFQTSLGWIEVSYQKFLKIPKVEQLSIPFTSHIQESWEKSMNLVTFVSFSPSQIAPQPTPPQNFHLSFLFGVREKTHDMKIFSKSFHGKGISGFFLDDFFHHMSHVSLGVSSILTLDIP